MRRSRWPMMCLILAAAWTSGCTTDNPNVDPRADAALRRMSSTLAEAGSFKMHSRATIEDRVATGQVVQFTRDSTMLVRRPDQLVAEVRRGSESMRLWHQGKELTALDTKRNVYTVIQTPSRIDELLDFLADEYDIVVPLDDLLQSDPYKGLMEDVTTGAFVDQQSIDGHKCDHLAFTQDNVDWQIWIDTGAQAVPRKVVITYKLDPDSPQFEAVLSDWQLNLPVEAAQFTPQVAKAARRVEVEDFLGAVKGD